MRVTLMVFISVFTVAAYSSDVGTCNNRGDLDTPYCDQDKDLVADIPTDTTQQRNPDKLVFGWAPVEHPAAYEKLFNSYAVHLAKCTGKKVELFKTKSHIEEIEAMRSGRIHIGRFATGQAAFAVNIAGAVPFGVKGDDERFHGYNLFMIVRKDSPYRKLTALKGKTVAHVSSSSNSGHLAPMALFPSLGLTPGKDYKIVFSGKQDDSILGVKSGKYDAASVASDSFYRMAALGLIKEDDFRIVYISPTFPADVIAYAHDLAPPLRDQILKCTYNYRFDHEVRKTFADADRFYPVTYKKDWELVRSVAALGDGLDRKAYDNLKKREKQDD